MIEKYQIAARLRSRRLIDLIVVSSYFSIVKSMLFVSTLVSIEKLLESDALHPSDLSDPYSQIRDLVYSFIIFSSTNNIHVRSSLSLKSLILFHLTPTLTFLPLLSQKSDDRIGSLFAEERLKPTSVWDQYFLPIERFMRINIPPYIAEYERVFSPTSRK